VSDLQKLLDCTHLFLFADVVLSVNTMPGAQVASPALPEPMDTSPTPVTAATPTSCATGSSGSGPSLAMASTSGSQGSSRSRSFRKPVPVKALQDPPLVLQVSKEKFEMPMSDFAPTANRVWLSALQRVVVDPNRVEDHPNRMLLRGYALPDPHAFLKSSRANIYTVSWLIIKPLWLNMATNRTAIDGKCSPYPEPQDWRIFLTDLFSRMGLTVASSSSGSHIRQGPPPTAQAMVSRQGREKRRKIKQDDKRVDKFLIDTSELTSPSDVFWRGKLLLNKDALRNNNFSISATVAREVVFELFNNNFGLELLAADRVMFPHHTMSEQEGTERDGNVSYCFPDGVLVGMSYPKVDNGLGALHWQDRIEYVEAFRLLLSTWRGSTANELRGLSPLLATSLREEVEAVERISYPFYCQTFFDFFGRAPCVPCQLPRD
jgi:hypothetical protein